MIINRAIAATDFPKNIGGMEFEQVQYLLVLCFIFLLLVAVNGGFKYFVNVYKGRLGERMLRRLRYQLFSHTLRFPLPHFRRTSQGEIIAMITLEVEPLGGFIGDAIAQPVFQGGTLLTILAFMFAQDVVLGLAAVALYPLQVWLIPKLQRQVNALAKERVRTVRRLSERIGETVSAIEEIHANDTSERHRADFARWAGTIYEIRFRIYKKKFFIKFLNNFIAQLTPFFFYSIGGYLVIRGELTFGALVAVLSAYKDLSSPWKELLDWYQQKEDARVKYEQLVEQFRPVGMLPEELQATPETPVVPLAGPVTVSNVTLEDESGVKTVDGASFHFDLKERLALVGSTGSGIDDMAKLLARLLAPTAGTICFGDVNLATVPEAVTGRRLAYVGQHAAVLSGRFRDNLYYGLQHAPIRVATAESTAERADYVREARLSGNTASDPDADWTDYGSLGLSGGEDLARRAGEILETVDLEHDLFALGLRGALDGDARARLADRILDARRRLRERLAEPAYAGLVETFDRDRYNSNMSVAENLLFGLPVGHAFDLDRLSEHPYVRQVLESARLREDFYLTGLSAARIMVDLFQDLPPGHEFFDRFSFISSEDLPLYDAAIRRVELSGPNAAAAEDRALFESLPFRLVPARHRLGLLDAGIERRLLQARHAFAEGLPDEWRASVAFFDAGAYNVAASVQDNILFGKLVYGRQQAQREIGALIAAVLDDLGLRADIVDLGLDFDVGVGGSRLSASQRQKLAIARALLKRPDLVVLDHATAAIEFVAQEAILVKLLRDHPDTGIVWVTSDEIRARRFDRIVVMEGGRVVAQGAPEDVLGGGEITATAGA